jgi:fructose-1,6-bisphosphatase-3
VSKGESPLKANNRLIVIDGGFCRAYQKTTGIAGYTLIYNSHGMRLKAHQPFESIEKVLTENKDIESTSNFFEMEKKRVMVKDTDTGREILETIRDLELLLMAYRQGIIVAK